MICCQVFFFGRPFEKITTIIYGLWCCNTDKNNDRDDADDVVEDNRLLMWEFNVILSRGGLVVEMLCMFLANM